ncbi:MAG: hypothetical protein KBS74_03550 [Clostridiales bacterium]|nr:hypothetical protein [Candidatus Cacconaster stercorequi]
MEKLTYYFTPFVIFFVYRIGMCFWELKRNEKERVKTGVFHAVKHIYTEIGLFIGATIGGVLILLFPKLWYVFAVIGAALCYFGFKMGRERGIAFDNALRELALEMKKMETEELTAEEHPAIAENATPAENTAPAENEETVSAAEEETAPAEEEQKGEIK